MVIDKLSVSRIFLAWDFSTEAIRDTLESLKRHDQLDLTFDIPGLVSPEPAIDLLRDVVYSGISDAHRVMALLEKPNANVGFEVGLAWGMNKDVALATFGSRPAWLNQTPFAHLLTEQATTARELRAIAKRVTKREGADGGVAQAEGGGAGTQHRTMFLCPKRYEGEGYRTEQLGARPEWHTLPTTSFNLQDLPAALSGVTQLVWTICAVPSHTGLRDGEENTAHALVAGWFLAQQLRELGKGAWSGEGMSELRRRFVVLRAKHAAQVVDVGRFEQVYDGLAQYQELLKRVPETPTAKRRQPEYFINGKERLRAFLSTALSLSQVPQLAHEIGGDTLRLEVVAKREKAEQVGALVAHLSPESVDRWFRFLPRHFPGSARELDELASQLHGEARARAPSFVDATSDRAELVGYPVGTTFGEILSLAYRLDRKQQWGQLLDECGQHRHAIFLLRGGSRQGLGLFMDRLRRFLEARAMELSVATVAFRHGFHCAESAAEWLRRLALALGRGEPGQAHEHLRARAEVASPFVVLGMQPFRVLETYQKQGLRQFLTEIFPRCVLDAAPNQPVRAFLAVEDDDIGEDLAEQVDLWAGLGAQYYRARRKEVSDARDRPLDMQYIPLAPVSFPSWEEVRDYLDSSETGPALAVRRRIHQDYVRLMSNQYASFQELAQLLHHHIGPI